MRVLLAQTQKPSFETRIYDKLGQGISIIPNCSVFIAGRKVEGIPSGLNPKIEFIHCFRHGRGTFERLRNIFIFFRLIRDSKPTIVVVCSPDLLLPAVLFKLAIGVKVIFDIQENFELNIRHQAAYSTTQKFILPDLISFYFRSIFCFIDRFWLAEEIYSNQMALPKLSFVLENKVPLFWKTEVLKYEIGNHNIGTQLLFSGVITEEAGLISVLDFFEMVGLKASDISLVLCGVVQNIHHFSKVNGMAGKGDKISFDLNNQWKSSRTILQQYLESDAIIIAYRESDANVGKFPTKLFEALFIGKPVLCQKGGYFSKLASRYTKVIEVNFDQPLENDFELILEEIKSHEPQNLYLEKFMFDYAGLRNDFLSLLEQDFNIKP